MKLFDEDDIPYRWQRRKMGIKEYELVPAEYLLIDRIRGYVEESVHEVGFMRKERHAARLREVKRLAKAALDGKLHTAARLGFRVIAGGKKGGKAKTGTSRATEQQRTRFLAELAKAKDPTYNARVLRAMRRSGWPLSQTSARKLGERAGMK